MASGNPRRVALEVLAKTEAGQYANLALDAALKRTVLSPADRSLATALVYGVLERQGWLDYAIPVFAHRPPEQITPDARALLRLGLYQLCFLERVPDHAAVNETVTLAGRRLAGFVNAVLREAIRQGKRLPLPPKEPLTGWIAVRYSVHPRAGGAAVCGSGRCENGIASRGAGNAPPLTLRVNTLRTTREKLLDVLKERGFDAVRPREAHRGFCFPPAHRSGSCRGLMRGCFSYRMRHPSWQWRRWRQSRECACWTSVPVRDRSPSASRWRWKTAARC